MAVLGMFLGGVFPASNCQGQWVISAIHPDPTPPLGAPDAEFVALLALGASDSCLSLAGHTLEWNGHERPLSDGCWPTGSVVVVHRASDSLAFDWGGAYRLPLASWPALVNGGATVALRDASGACLDAMPYSSGSLGSGGRPLMRREPSSCGGSVNQMLWEEGMSPFQHAWEGDEPSGEDVTSVALIEARKRDRWVPRGPGHADWYLGTALDPVFILESRAWVGGQEAFIEWPSDSVVHLNWPARAEAISDPLQASIPVLLGPLRACPSGATPTMFTHDFLPGRDFGPLRVVEALPDPTPGTPSQTESFALHNPTGQTVDVGSWTFGGARLRRNISLPADSVVRFNAGQFEDWPGMPNSRGFLPFLRQGIYPAGGVVWDACDYSFPDHVASGAGLVRDGAPGSPWATYGVSGEEEDPISIKGFGCIRSFSGAPVGLELYLNRHALYLPEIQWLTEERVELDGQADPVYSDGLILSWPGMETELIEAQGVHLMGQVEGGDVLEVLVQCPPAVDQEPVCLRVDELLWNASEKGAEFVEVLNCGTQAVDLKGLQSTTAEFPFPSDWDMWVPMDRSLILLPGKVAAFGKCAGWMGYGLAKRGPSRWSVEEWSSLNDEGGTLSVRLIGQPELELDRVVWSSEWEGPWWWDEDGWAWVRGGDGADDWSPAANRGSPGAPQASPPSGQCDGAVELLESEDGLPGLHWEFPDAGGTIEVRVVHWPSGELVEHRFMERSGTKGQWAWPGRRWAGAHQGEGAWLFSVRWWSGMCRGRRIMSAGVPRWN